MGKKLPPHTRNLMFKVIDGSAAVAPGMYIPPMLWVISRHPQCDEILNWLIERGIVGQRFLNWVKLNYGNDIRLAIPAIVRNVLALEH